MANTEVIAAVSTLPELPSEPPHVLQQVLDLWRGDWASLPDLPQGSLLAEKARAFLRQPATDQELKVAIVALTGRKKWAGKGTISDQDEYTVGMYDTLRDRRYAAAVIELGVRRAVATGEPWIDGPELYEACDAEMAEAEAGILLLESDNRGALVYEVQVLGVSRAQIARRLRREAKLRRLMGLEPQ